MRRLRALCLLVGLMACEPPVVVEPAPAAPVFAALESPTPFARVKLKAAAPADTRVRVFVDETCSGPVLMDVSSAELSDGVEVALVPRFDNVFTARAVSMKGLRSECSTPLTVRLEPKEPPAKPTLRSEPSSPSRQGRFRLTGTTPDAERVAVFRGSCGAQLVWQGSQAEFESEGVALLVPENTGVTFAVQSTDLTGQHSQCAAMTLSVDRAPPRVFRAEVKSPNPSSSPLARLHVSGDSDLQSVQFFTQPHCVGPAASVCSFANGDCDFIVQFVERELRWSVSGLDGLGNASCLNGAEPLELDDSLPSPPAPELRANGVLLESRIPVYWPSSQVWFFAAADCEGPVVWDKTEGDAARSVFVDPGTVWSARMANGGKCSNTVIIPSN